jgi:NADH-quinone oxidoreductase subunit C
MTDFAPNIGITSSDKVYRQEATHQGEDWVSLSAQDSPELALVEKLFQEEIVASRLFRGESTLWVKSQKIIEILTALRDDPLTQYNFLSDLTCVDLLKVKASDDAARFQIVYNLYSLATFRRFRVNALIDGAPEIDTSEGVWLAANWLEREVYDLFGIVFKGHSDLRRIQLPDEWVGHPLRKDQPLGGEEVEFSFNVKKR